MKTEGENQYEPESFISQLQEALSAVRPPGSHYKTTAAGAEAKDENAAEIWQILAIWAAVAYM